MPSIAQYLQDFVNEASRPTPDLEQELRQIEARKQEIERKLQIAHLALDRAGRFVAMSGPNRYCPRCWVFDERHNIIDPIGGGTREYDLFRCRVCRTEYEINF